MRKKKGGADAIADAIKNPTKTIEPRRAPMLPDGLGGRFEARESGIFRKNGEGIFLRAFDLLWVLAETRDTLQGNWGLLLGWYDGDHIWHEEIVDRAMFCGECNELRARLALGRFTVPPFKTSREAFAEFISAASSTARARAVMTVGWHHADTGSAFILPDRVIGTTTEQIVFQGPRLDRNPFEVAGTLPGWTNKLSVLCGGNSRLVLSISTALAAPIFGPLGELGGGFNLRGASRSGKSTALIVAASVMGGTRDRGAAGYVKPWRATANGLETIAAAHSDCLLCLDEMGQVDAKEVGEIAYLLANGQGKIRSTRQGNGGRPIAQFQCLFLSTSEQGLADVNREGGKTTKVGMENRITDISADPGAGHGAFEDLHGAQNGAAFAGELAELCREEYGTAGPAFIARFIEEWRRSVDFPAVLRGRAQTILSGWLNGLGDAGGQVLSVGGRFASVALAGELAEEWGIVAWPRGNAIWGVGQCFAAWLNERGGLGAREDEKAVELLREFIIVHAPTWLQVWPNEEESDPADQTVREPRPPPEGFRPPKRTGFRRFQKNTDGTNHFVYFLASSGMREALTGLAFCDALRTLAKRGVIPPADKKGRHSRPMTVPGVGKVRLYEIASNILSSGDGDTAD